jgi:hypothetical protein
VVVEVAISTTTAVVETSSQSKAWSLGSNDVTLLRIVQQLDSSKMQ